MTHHVVRLTKSQFTAQLTAPASQVAIITIDHPPVNALSQAVRAGLIECISQAEADPQVKVIVIRCAHRTFIAGADIREFGQPPTAPLLPEVVNRIEASTKPVVAELFGTILGGGLEVALACHYRVALTSAKVGFPEVNLGLIPGAGGTQRAMRLLGPKLAVDMITSGKPQTASALADTPLFDRLFDSDLTQHGLQFAEQLVANWDGPASIRRVGELAVAGDIDWAAAREKIVKQSRGADAPLVALEVMQATADKDLQQGMAYERQQFLKLRDSEQSAALRYGFAAEKAATKLALDAEPQPVKVVGVIGAGTMGSGIATAFLLTDHPVILIEQNPEGLAAGVQRVQNNLQQAVKRGRLTSQQATEFEARLHTSLDYQSLRDCDLVIEAVFEDLALKKTIMAKLEHNCQPHTILATNTSYLDINAIADGLARPQQLVGMHFFSPAHVMKLLEVVQGQHTSATVIATAMAVAKRLRKQSVLVGVCFGFAGNRMYTRYGREIQQILLEGASVAQIDQAMKNFGMAMGPLAVQDLSGIDIGHSARSSQPFPKHDPGYFRAAATMVAAGRLGRKTQGGFYDYAEDGQAYPSEQVSQLLAEQAAQLAISPRQFSEQEIAHRALMALISEGLALVAAGIVQRMSDIDVIWLHGYGFPRHKGGPMWQAKQLGADQVLEQLSLLQRQYGTDIWPSYQSSVLAQLEHL